MSRGRRRQAEEIAEVDDSLLDPDERAYIRARRLADMKVDLYTEAVKKGAIVLVVSLFAGPFIGGIVALFIGIPVAQQFFRVFIEPQLRERLVEEEVSKQVQESVTQERRTLEGEHARSLEQLSASIAHEIRNPITAAKSLVQQMGEDPTGDDNVEYAQVALGELERVERSISHLLRFARDEEVRMTDVRMSDVLDSAIETFRDRAVRSGVEIVKQFDCEGVLTGDAEKLRRVVINLVGNAIDALDGAAVEKPRVEVAMGENLAGTEVWVRVRDNGIGMDEEMRERIFNPFFTRKRGGTGLGLPITKKLVESHHGTIELDSRPGEGTEFVLVFPKNPGRAGAGEEA